MHIGYARVSTKDQNLALQIDALKKANCDRVYEEVACMTRIGKKFGICCCWVYLKPRLRKPI